MQYLSTAFDADALQTPTVVSDSVQEEIIDFRHSR